MHPMRASLAAVVAAGFGLLAAGRPASAGEFGVSFDGGYFGMTNASKSAKAVFDGSGGGFTLGGSARYVVARSLYFGVGVRHFSKEGERVFVASASGTPFPLGHPLTFSELSVYGMVGWRFRPDTKLVPYVALGAGSTSVKEKSVVGDIEESLDQSKFSGHFIGGVEYGRSTLRFGAEVMYTTVPNSIGVAGVSKIYGEDDVGGFSAVGRIILAF
jgi:hypothetical protein